MGTLVGYYSSQLLSAGTEAASKLDEDRIFALDGQMIFDAVVLAINIFILFIILSYVLFNPVRKMLQDRQNKIASDIDTANTDKEAAAALKQEYDDKLKDVNKEAELILSDARKKALKNQERIEREAREEAQRIIEHAKAEAELEKQKAADDVKKEIILVSTLMAGKLVEVSIDKQKQDSLVEETLREIGDETWLS